MIKKKVFCEECRNDRTFTVTAKQTEGTIKVHCCSVQRKNDIVPLDVILKKPEKYA